MDEKIELELQKLKADIKKMKSAIDKDSFNWNPYPPFEVVLESSLWNPLSTKNLLERKKKNGKTKG